MMMIMMNILRVFFLISVMAFKVRAYLTPSQRMLINRILQNPNTTDSIRNPVKQILANHYRPWTISQYKEFKRVRNISKHYYDRDLQQYAYLGLLKALNKYDGRSPLSSYAHKYVIGEICRGIRELENYPKIYVSNMEQSWWDKPSHDLSKYHLDNISIRIMKIHDVVSTFPADYIRMFYYRYDRNTLEIVRSVPVVCELMGFSHETYRTRMNEIKLLILDLP